MRREAKYASDPDTVLLELDTGGDMIILVDGSEERTFGGLRAWVRAEVLEYDECVTLERVRDLKEQRT